MFKIGKKIRTNFDYRTIRALHICVIFTLAFLIELLLKFPRGSWTPFTVMMIYVGFDIGTSIQRIIHRFFGVVLGLFSAMFLWFFGHVDYRILLLVIPTMVGFYFYLLGKPYVFPTVFTVILSVLGSDYFPSNTFFVSWFFWDYFTCTVLAAIICLVFEYFVFRHVNMTRKFYVDLQKSLLEHLEIFFDVVKNKQIRKSIYIKATVEVNKKVIELRNFVNNTKNDYHNKDNLIAEVEDFTQDVNVAYQNVRKMFILPFEKRPILIIETEHLIQRLKQKLALEKSEEISFEASV